MLNSWRPIIRTTCRQWRNASTATAKHAQEQQSCCPPQTVLPGLNYLKGQAAVVAQEDGDYPPWLWRVMEPKEWPEDTSTGAKEKADRKKTNKRRLREHNFMKTQ